MSDDQKSSKTQIKTASVKPMTALQGYLDDMLSVATSAVAHEEIEPKTEETVVETKSVVEEDQVVETITAIDTVVEPEP